MVTEQVDIIVVGAGLVGTACALHIAQTTSLQVALIERAAALDVHSCDDNQRVVALGATAVGLLKKLEVFDHLSRHQAHAYQSMMVWDENSNGELLFQASEFEQTELGFMVDSLACTQALQSKALNKELPNLRSFFDTQIDQLQFNDCGVSVRCQDQAFDARLLIGADGARSWVRTQAKIFANRRAYEQQGIVAKIKTSHSHNDCAWQRFLSSGPVAALPVHDNYSSIVWSADDLLAKRLMLMPDEEFCLALARAFDHRLGDVIELGPRQSFPLVSQKASAYIGPSVALIGDSAHSIHPLAGQGANLGFKDALCLSELVCEAEPDELGKLALLSRYQRRRKPDNEQTDWLMSALNVGFKAQPPWWLTARGAGMNWLNDSDRGGSLKKLLARQAMGL